MKAKTIDEFCGAPAGTFAKFVQSKEAFLKLLEEDRKKRIRESRTKTNNKQKGTNEKRINKT